MNPFGIHNYLAITVCDDVEEAKRDFNWAQQPNPPKPVQIRHVVVVRGGTQSGASTVDFELEDKDGNRYVFMVTHKLLSSIPA